MAKLLYQGHASYRIIDDAGHVIYVDPFTGGGYNAPADLILVTHQHRDHNKVALCAKKPGCRVITNVEALAGGRHNDFDLGWVRVSSTTACNKRHSADKCVGYIIELSGEDGANNGIKIYAAGDTSKTEEMGKLAALDIDYALLPGDGVFNMGLDEAAECARLIGAKHNIPIHLKPPTLFKKNRYDRVMAESWAAPNKLVVEPGNEISL
ncbi:MAG: MBL fold metallo-hydrolase [Coriobacteriales bacterium]|jgi:L-ascorbate metabolism protein UlaG (beta-lactamase superfamily)|nr:MBL fold metallo-hydrolase [Coriobacteriales bacterium]